MIGRRSKWAAPALGVAFAALVLVAPALAHKGERHQAAAEPAPAASSAAQAGSPGMPGMDMSSQELSWPTQVGGESGMMMSHKDRPKTMEGRAIAWMGAWHPAVIHFPIALLLVVAFLELAAVVRRKPLYNASNKLLLALAVAGAFVAAPLGWADAGWPTPQDDLALTAHRWLGSAIPFLLLLLWHLKRPAEQAAVRPSSRLYEAVLAVSVLVILAQAYMGGEITHGANHMAF